MASIGETRRKHRILITEDDRVTREYVAGLLRGSGLEVETVDSAQKCIDAAQKNKPDLVLLDILMPGMSGLECCRILKSLPGFLPVILVTAKTDIDSRVEGLRLGADDYVCKPFDERELSARVQAALRVKQAHDDVFAAKARLEEVSIRDELTTLYNYRYLTTRMNEEFKRAERHREPLACAMIDIDYFKKVNDTYGHDAGDAVLAETARRMKAAVREIDVVARYGGEEFLVLLPNTQLSGALTVAERIFRGVSVMPMRHGVLDLRVTISIGVATYPSREVRSKDQLVKTADTALYQAKHEGRNRICVFSNHAYTYTPSPKSMSSRPPRA